MCQACRQVHEARKLGVMKRIGLKIAIMALLASSVSAWAAESSAVRNCTWCHGAGRRAIRSRRGWLDRGRNTS
jgi:hypothetical protein